MQRDSDASLLVDVAFEDKTRTFGPVHFFCKRLKLLELDLSPKLKCNLLLPESVGALRRMFGKRRLD